MQINTCTGDVQQKVSSNKMTKFKFQVLFLMENLGYEPMEN